MVVGRFAPSPSGRMHLGNARTALLAWLDVRSRGGRMLLRVEDLDRDRCRPDWAAGVREDLAWLGLDWDAETPAQSTRTEAYAAALEQLASRGLVYECFCSRRDLAAASAPHGGERRYPGTCADLTADERARWRGEGRAPALRVRMPERPVACRDRLHGGWTEPVAAVTGDVVCRRSDGLHAYQLAVVVDDAADGVTDVVRGDDLLGSTARQVALAELLGLPAVVHGHVPLVLAGGARLAKRDRPPSLSDLRRAGADPAEVVAALAGTAGLAQGARRVHPRDLVDGFALERIDRAPAAVEPGLRARAS